MKRTLLLIAVAAAGLPCWAEGAGDTVRGQAYAHAMCASCHAINADGASPTAAARPFRTLDLAKWTGDTLATYVNTKHPSIPSSLLKPVQAEDILAYVAGVQHAN